MLLSLRKVWLTFAGSPPARDYRYRLTLQPSPTTTTSLLPTLDNYWLYVTGTSELP
jgi:hypothetical protein